MKNFEETVITPPFFEFADEEEELCTKMKNFAVTFVKMKKRNEADEDEEEERSRFQWVLRTTEAMN